MHHQKSPDWRFIDAPYFQAADAAAVARQTGVEGACLLQQFGFVCFDQVLSCIDVSQVKQLHLTDHLLRAHPGSESASGLRQFCHKRNGSHHRRFFHHHWYQDRPAVHDEILGDPQRQAEETHRVLNHVAGGLKAQPRAWQPGFQVILIQAAVLQQELIAFRQGHLVEFFGHINSIVLKSGQL